VVVVAARQSVKQQPLAQVAVVVVVQVDLRLVLALMAALTVVVAAAVTVGLMCPAALFLTQETGVPA
jgi:hypothetical protein